MRLIIAWLAVTGVLIFSQAAAQQSLTPDSARKIFQSLSANDYAEPVDGFIEPSWPPDAPSSVWRVIVLVRVHICDDGSVDSTQPVYCSEPYLCFETAALATARKAKFLRMDNSGTRFPQWEYYPFQFWSPIPHIPPDSQVVVDKPVKELFVADPVYPADDLMNGVSGTVWVKVLVGPGGLVRECMLSKTSGHPTLDTAALAASMNCRFNPALKDDRPVPVWFEFSYEFKPPGFGDGYR